jgi:hypothetical protein
MMGLYQKPCLLIMTAVSYQTCRGEKRTYKPSNARCYTAPYHTPHRSTLTNYDFSFCFLLGEC